MAIEEEEIKAKKISTAFWEFLEAHKVVDWYIEHTKRSQEVKHNRSLEEFLNTYVSTKPRWLLSSAFTWADTTEGDSFWRNLSQEWRKLLDSLGEDV